ncbi:outer membrane protein [Bradyrhizobium erythrophlei]|uniref:Outer membrane immunogenic protein n=1 Tax=Bradyrhizobium erythrophlei TaxID=1437360 RepID=A0A1M7UFN5_9BRAD|nr:outer membrane beta-barrel protein [Bradyrhizobium erythrophlei]SHN81705.1 outer membrane immunogenic protein [Bradyrhizobium erythrophlei]
MKKLLLVSSALVAAGPAFAADLPLKAPPMALPVLTIWSSCHVGGHIGSGADRVNYSDPGTFVPGSGVVQGITQNFAPAGAPFSASGQPAFLGGVQAGCDYQFDNHWVIGIGGDFSWTNLSSLVNDPFFGGKNGNPMTLSTRTDEIATVTGRVGYAFDNVLFYGKGGAAFAHDRYAVNNSAFVNEAFLGCSTPTVTFTGCNLVGSADRWGWTAGVGVEWAFAKNWSAMVEFDHYGFDAKTVSMNVVGNTFLVTPANLTVKHDIDTVKVGINYRFWSPVVARY